MALDRRTYGGWTLCYLLQRVPMPCPLTHQALSNVIAALGATLEDVVIDRDERFRWCRADLRLRVRSQPVTVDVRPSDALALATVRQVPIFIRSRLACRGVS